MDWRSYRKGQIQHPRPVLSVQHSGQEWSPLHRILTWQQGVLALLMVPTARGVWGRAELLPAQQSGTDQINQAIRDLLLFMIIRFS